MQMPALPELTAEGEKAWLKFRRHLDWAEGFALIFLFSSTRQVVDIFRRRLEDTLVFHTAQLMRIAPESPDDLITRTMAAVRHGNALFPAGASALWIEMTRGDGDIWEAAQKTVLARLNEHRELLRQNISQPVVMVLPGSRSPFVRQFAPDLWSIRDFSIDLDQIAVLRRPPPELPDGVHGVIHANLPSVHASLSGGQLPEQIVEWQRLQRKGAVGPEALRTGWVAVQSAREAGLAFLAEKIASDALDLARSAANGKIDAGDTPQVLRDLSVSLNKAGDTARDLGRLEDAKNAFDESLALMRRLHEQLGDSPNLLWDMATALVRVGQNAEDSRRMAAAAAAYEEVRAITQRLIAIYPNTQKYVDALADTNGRISRLSSKK